jgi:hypothetical protein
MKRFLRENGLSLVSFGFFFLFFVGQSITGMYAYNHEQVLHGGQVLSWLQYISGGEFWEVTGENWESEFLQMGMYVILTAWLFQRGSAESKDPDEKEDVDEDPSKVKNKRDTPWPVRRGGLALNVYKHSLSLAFFVLFLISFLMHAAGGAREFSEEQAEHGISTAVTMWQYMGTSRFWFESFQNWQSEFLAVFSIVVLSIFLREKGSPESKPVATPHHEQAS